MVKSNTLYNLTKAERQKLIKRLASLLEDDEKILFAYLHGSFNEETAFRDLDIAVYLQQMPSDKMLLYELKLEEDLQSALHYPIDLKVLNSAPPHFCYMVIKKGVKLIVRDDQKRVAFEMRTLKKYFDFEPIRRRYLQEVNNA